MAKAYSGVDDLAIDSETVGEAEESTGAALAVGASLGAGAGAGAGSVLEQEERPTARASAGNKKQTCARFCRLRLLVAHWPLNSEFREILSRKIKM